MSDIYFQNDDNHLTIINDRLEGVKFELNSEGDMDVSIVFDYEVLVSLNKAQYKTILRHLIDLYEKMEDE